MTIPNQSNMSSSSKIKSNACPPVFDRRTVLLSHLEAIMRSSYKSEAGLVCLELRKKSDQELASLLSNKKELEMFVYEVKIREREVTPEEVAEHQELLGDQLFAKVAAMETELCAQITGMLLELDSSSIKNLLSNSSALQTAVSKAKGEYLHEKFPSTVLSSEDMGEQLYQMLAGEYPQNAEKITGMLLELGPRSLQTLLERPSELQHKIHQAKQSLEDAGIWTDS